MGHIDHGKSTLLDYIRKTKITEMEAGGITQHISAYEVSHTTSGNEGRRITFLDTPGHEAFQHLRSRGSQAADLAILVVAADDGVKPQTLEALKAIEDARIPFIVAITKIDKSNADIEHTKSSLLEHGVYLEGLGGSISYVPISSKSGEGVPELLDLVLLAADMEELTGDPTERATGLVIESHCDARRGISAVLLIRNGALHAGECVVAGPASAPLRIMEDFLGNPIKSASFSSPITVVGFSTTPLVGSQFTTVADKKQAALLTKQWSEAHVASEMQPFGAAADEASDAKGPFVLPVVIKSDVVGSIDAIKHELHKHEDEHTKIQVLHEGVGDITEGDVKYASGNKTTVVIGFNVKADAAADELARRQEIEVARFPIIYDLADWLPGVIAARRPKREVEEVLGRALVLKSFSHAKKHTTLGCRVEEGTLTVDDRVALVHGEETVGTGKIGSLKAGKSDTHSVSEENDCGAQISIELEKPPVYGDTIRAFRKSVS